MLLAISSHRLVYAKQYVPQSASFRVIEMGLTDTYQSRLLLTIFVQIVFAEFIGKIGVPCL